MLRKSWSVTLADDLEAGSLGYFWTLDSGERLDLESDPLRGYLRTHGQWVMLETLEEDVEEAWLREHQPQPQAVVGVLVNQPVLLLEVRPAGFAHSFGGFQASVQRFEARTVIAGLPPDRLISSNLRSMKARFLGISQWAGMLAVTEKVELDDRNRGKSWTVRAESSEPVSARLRGGGSLQVEAGWRTEGAKDRRVVAAPIEITCWFPTPRPAWDLLGPLARVQDLLSFLFGGYVSADSGTATLHLRKVDEPDRSVSPSLWNGLLMTSSPSASPPPKTAEPLLTLDQIGGPAGLARWVHLSTTHPRAVRPFLNRYRYGPTTTELGVMEAAAGIEHWVNAHTRTAAWAKGRKPHAERLARSLGRSFTGWTSDPVAWAELLRTTNNKLKHDPNAAIDQQLLSDLALSGQMALAAGTLNSVTRTKAPGAAIFGSYRFHGVGQRIRDALA